jgi:hypothetical protein
LPLNIRLARKKHSSLFCSAVSEEDTHFYSIETRRPQFFSFIIFVIIFWAICSRSYFIILLSFYVPTNTSTTTNNCLIGRFLLFFPGSVSHQFEDREEIHEQLNQSLPFFRDQIILCKYNLYTKKCLRT